MTRLLLMIVALCTFLGTAHANENDYANNQEYQSLAEDFRTYSVCQSIHQNLAMFIAINYGVGANLNFPPEWLEQQRSLINNISIQEELFGDKLILTMKKLNEDFGFPLQGLEQQKRNNQSGTTQQIIFTIANSIGDPDKVSMVVKDMLDQSVQCRQHESKVNYGE